ncbi:uncharacterized protein LOC120343310 [Styela clava]
MTKIIRLFVGFMLLCFIVDYQNGLAQGCHAGHQKKDKDDDDDDDDDEGLIIVDETNATLVEDEDVRSLVRSKRQLGEDYDGEFPILRAYFRDCMFDKVEEPWEWKSVIDFTILKTLWFLYSGAVACSEENNKDDTTCWKDCLDVYLRNTSSMLDAAKACVDEYQSDFLIGKKTYTIKRPAKTKVTPRPPSDNYERCVQIEFDDADPAELLQEVGILSVPTDADLNVETIVRFIKGHVQCVICDYSTLPSGQRKPDFKENIDIGEPKELPDGSVTYVVTWPFAFEALVRRDAKLRRAISFCNGELEKTFRKKPPRTAEWTQWFTWGTCNALCGKPGIQRRLRVCLDENGRGCPGNKFDRRTCYNRNCAYWTNWGPYTPCMSTCDLSEQYSFRYCKKGQPGAEGCQGSRIRSRSCAVGSCEVPWSQWTECSVSCGSGFQQRTGGDSLMKLRTEKRSCSRGRCPDKWTPWTPWSPCTKTCGDGGQHVRARICLTRACSEPARESVPCSSRPCKAQWGEWAPWSSCVYKRRSRICVGGNTCVGEREDYNRCPASESKSTQKPYPVGWSDWTSWTQCNASCDRTGYKRRSRKCLGGRLSECPGQKSNVIQCSNGPCTYSAKRPVKCKDELGIFCTERHISCYGNTGRKKCKKTCGYC